MTIRSEVKKSLLFDILKSTRSAKSILGEFIVIVVENMFKADRLLPSLPSPRTKIAGIPKLPEDRFDLFKVILEPGVPVIMPGVEEPTLPLRNNPLSVTSPPDPT